MLHAVIMAGGSGTRFWPASRNAVPKQLLDLAGDSTMIQSTLERLEGLVPAARVKVITNARLVDAIREQLPRLDPAAVLGEPCKRDTAPCIGLAAVLLEAQDPDATMLVMPSDHVISPAAEFRRAILQAAEMVDADPECLVTFGIRPTYPAESFGYIERGAPRAGSSHGIPAYDVAKFHEKPQATIAEQYLATGRYYWNSGIFVWKAATVLAGLQRHEPEMLERLRRIGRAAGTASFPQVLAEEFPRITPRSIDYAIMEKAQRVVVIEAPFQWDDVGSWQALARLRGHDSEGNTVQGKHLGIRTSRTIVRGPTDHLVVTIGVDNLVIVHTPDATLVVHRDQEEAVREAVKQLEQLGWNELL